jgi:hypothetical protein
MEEEEFFFKAQIVLLIPLVFSAIMLLAYRNVQVAASDSIL